MNGTAVTDLLLGLVGGVIYYGSAVPGSQILGRSLVRGRPGERRVALTFDDGPTPPFTEQILDILRQRNVPATFFVNGNHVQRFPDLLKRAHTENHTIGNHTYSHPFFYFKTPRRMASEIDRAQDSIERVIGLRPRVFRSPYGVRWFGLFGVLRHRGLHSVQWSDTGYDWVQRNSPAEIASKALKNLKDGSIILLHDGAGAGEPGHVDRSRTVAALPALIDGVQKAGYRFVSVEEFLA